MVKNKMAALQIAKMVWDQYTLYFDLFYTHQDYLEIFYVNIKKDPVLNVLTNTQQHG